MVTTSVVLFILGLLGALDIAMYHCVSHGIRSHPDSRNELLVHSLRGPTYATLFLVVPNVELRGAFFWALIALYAVDVSISIVDFAIERKSRELLGGLPSGEYVIHSIMAMFFGAMVATTFYEGFELASAPTSAAYHPVALPWQLRGAMAIMAISVFWSGVLDLAAAYRLSPARNRTSATG